ncbi:MAG: 23S rRNA (guanosine(2251)-2'-O)-methyltransferase RlmB [Myxococcota bacterium]
MSKRNNKRSSGKGRGRKASVDGPHLVPGPRAVVELLRHATGRIETLWLDRRREGHEIHSIAVDAGVEVQWVTGPELGRLAPDYDCQGVLARATPPRWHEFEDLVDAVVGAPPESNRRILVALDGVQDPQNLGAIMRSCEFFGVSGLLWPRDRAAGVTPAVVRASAGASERLPLCRVVNLARALEYGQDQGLWVLGTVVDGGEPLPSLLATDRVPFPLVLVMGGEHGGLRRLTRARCDLLATIPGRGGVASLNVSAATAAALVLLQSEAPTEGADGQQETVVQAD